MKCMYCNCMDSRVVDSRPTEEGTAIRRRRECENCGKRFTTYEKMEMVPLQVVKKDKRREPFDAQKLREGIVKSCEKRPVAMADIESLTREIELAAYNSLEQEISSQQIGEMVMEGLKKLDEVSYVRFASVYRHFRDIQSFVEELNKLLGQEETHENES